MFKSLRRNRLVKQGMASGKTRRRLASNPLVRRLEGDPAIRALVVALFAVFLAAIYPPGPPAPRRETLVLALLVLGVSLAHLHIEYPDAFTRNSRLLLILGTHATQLGLARLVLATTPALDPDLAPFAQLAIPFALAPITLSLLLGRRVALHAAIHAGLWTCLLPSPICPRLLALSLAGGFAAAAATARVRKRTRLFRAGLAASLAAAATALVFNRLGAAAPLAFADVPWPLLGRQTLVALLVGILTATFVGGILPLLEGAFRITTDISWLEAADLNHPLLAEMSLKAPGTYYHSMAVAQLAEAAAETVAANDVVCRVCSYFHDIGKLVKPHYFSENIMLGPRQRANPHDELTATMSTLIIKAHVKDGVDLALKHRLNPTIVDVINQHHGTSIVSFFYSRGRQHDKDVARGSQIMKMRSEEDADGTSEEQYRYDGPKPQFKECAIVSLADAVESAARALSRPTPNRIDQIVETILKGRIADGQLDECGLTLGEIDAIGDSFRATLPQMMHGRIRYGAEPDTEEDRSPREPRPTSPGPPRGS